MLYHNCFHGKLSRSIQPGNVVEATTAYSPMNFKIDYHVPGLNKQPSHEPIYINFYERYMVLSEMVNLSLNHFPHVDFVLIKAGMPSMVNLTRILLNEKVFFCEEVKLEKESLLTLKKQFLTIEDNFKRTSHEDSDNSITVNAYTFEDITVEFGLIILLLEKFGVKNIEK